MEEQKAFVFDTNFIIQHHDLKEVVETLNQKGFTVYVTQVAISERIAQECIKQKGKYEKLEALKNDVCRFAKIEITRSYEDTEAAYHTGMQKKYEDQFADNIIPLNTDAEMFQRVLDRAYMKTPPFIQGETDKGFKDSLMWLSILDYFRDNGEKSVVFVSNDHGFRDNKEELSREFYDETGKEIDIQDNSYYATLTAVAHNSPKHVEPQELSAEEREALSNQIEDIFNQWCMTEVEDDDGESYLVKTFQTYMEFDSGAVQNIFDSNKDTVKQHLFEKVIKPSLLLASEDRTIQDKYMIPITAIEQGLKLYGEVTRKYRDYIEPFCLAVAAIFNRNVGCTFALDDDDQLPF